MLLYTAISYSVFRGKVRPGLDTTRHRIELNLW